MKNSFQSFIGAAKKIRLNPVEKQAVKAVLGFTRPALAVPLKTDGLFAYEKAVMWSMLADMTKKQPALAVASADTQLKITVWHGSVFRHLQPFVLAQQD